MVERTTIYSVFYQNTFEVKTWRLEGEEVDGNASEEINMKKRDSRENDSESRK